MLYSREILHSIADFRVNFIIKILIISDFLVWSSYNLLSPIFAIFVIERIPGTDMETVGIAAAIYLVCKAIFEIPVGIYIDKTRAEKDDLYTAVIGTLLTALAYYGYGLIDSVWQLYGLQMVLGISAAIAFPGWYSIFTRHVDKARAGFTWSLYDVLLGIGMAGAAALGGYVATESGFETLFFLVSLCTFAGALLLFAVKNKIHLSVADKRRLAKSK